MPVNFFDLFQLPVAFDIDIPMLETRYRQLQSEVHPDRYVTATPSERLRSMQLATEANEAYRTLKHPTTRAQYLLQLQGFEILESSNTSMPADFLMQQMEWRETIEEAKHARDINALDQVLNELRSANKQLQSELKGLLNQQPEAAVIAVRKLVFLDKVSADVQEIISALED